MPRKAIDLLANLRQLAGGKTAKLSDRFEGPLSVCCANTLDIASDHVGYRKQIGPQAIRAHDRTTRCFVAAPPSVSSGGGVHPHLNGVATPARAGQQRDIQYLQNLLGQRCAPVAIPPAVDA